MDAIHGLSTMTGEEAFCLLICAINGASLLIGILTAIIFHR